MKSLSKLNKMAFLAFAGLAIGGCGFFGDLFGVVNVNSTQGKFGEGQSVCNSIKKSDIFSLYDNTNRMGNLVNGVSVAQVEKALNVQIHYIDIKRNEKDNICGFVMTMDNAYNKITLTSQEIAQLERALVDSDKYHYYENNKEVKNNYYVALKFLKYIKKFTIPNGKERLESLEAFGQGLEHFDGRTPVSIYRFLFGKKQYLLGYNFTAGLRSSTSLGELQNFFNDYYTKNRPCEPSISKADCSSHLNEIRAIKNYAESLLK